MRHSSFFVHLLLIQSIYPDTKYVYQKLLSTPNPPEILINTSTSVSPKARSSVSSTRLYSKTQRANSITVEHIDLTRSYEYKYGKTRTNTCGSRMKMCGRLKSHWCCSVTKGCGTNKHCDIERFNEILVICFWAFGILVCCVCCCNVIRILVFDYAKFKNGWTVEPLQISIQSSPVLASYSVTILHNTDNPNLQRPSIQNLIRDTLLRNSTASVEQQQPSLFDNYSTRRETTTSLERRSLTLPPAYDDLIQQKSTTITIEEQSLSPPPPTYNDFMRENWFLL